VLCADVLDYGKLSQLMRYIRGTRELALRLVCDYPIVVNAYVDASYATRPDFKSQAGVAITLGQGTIYPSSRKQSIVSKSSTEAELVAVSDSMGQLIHTRNFILDLGYTVGPSHLHQDNKETMSLIDNGRSNSSRTRHISIRYFFVADRVRGGEVVVIWCPSTEMVSDMLTKPVSVTELGIQRPRLLGDIRAQGNKVASANKMG
jgi:hypothetical protein